MDILPFKYTAEGYRLAKQYLINTGQLDLMKQELSQDGYTLVALANHLIERQNESNIRIS